MALRDGKIIDAPCDANFGPLPQECRVQEIQNTKTALVYYRIVCHTTNCTNTILSNRWSITATVDWEGFTTRVIRGRTIVRADVVASGLLTADAFRQDLMVPPPVTFQRLRVDVSENGSELNWTATDKETFLRIGALSPATHIEFNATAGWVSYFKTLAGQVTFGVEVMRAGMDILSTRGVGSKIMKAAGLAAFLTSSLPITTGSALVRVFGRATSDKRALAQIALNIVVDRFFPMAKAGDSWVSSMFLTQTLEPFVELRVEIFANTREEWLGLDATMSLAANITHAQGNDLKTGRPHWLAGEPDPNQLDPNDQNRTGPAVMTRTTPRP